MGGAHVTSRVPQRRGSLNAGLGLEERTACVELLAEAGRRGASKWPSPVVGEGCEWFSDGISQLAQREVVRRVISARVARSSTSATGFNQSAM